MFGPPRRKGKTCLMPFKADNSVGGCRRAALSEEAGAELNTVQPTTAAEQPGGMWERQDWGTVRGLGNTILRFFFHFLSQGNWSCLRQTPCLDWLLNSQTKSIIS